jgi:transposase
VGRESEQIRLSLAKRTDKETLQPFVEQSTAAEATVNTDEWKAYGGLEQTGRTHSTVCHAPGKREWARDDDGDGIREVHSNTIEGIWTGLRNFLRPFRGVSKWFLAQYAALFEWTFNLKAVNDDFLRVLLGVNVKPAQKANIQ